MTARHELDRLCQESWRQLGHDLKATSNNMGRVGLSCARRHPALLLGGGALLGLGAMLWLTRGKKHERHAVDHDHAEDRSSREQAHSIPNKVAKPSKTAHFAAGAAVKILKSAARMWLLQHLSSEVSAESKADENAPDRESYADSAT